MDKFWEKTDILPIVAEHDTSISGFDDKQSGFLNFCPEISFDVFGLFASNLHQYTDEIDRDVTHRRLEGEANPRDWRWQWASVLPLHYLKCPVYSQLTNRPIETTTRKDSDRKDSEELLELKPGFFGFSVDLKHVFNRFARWWLRNHGK